MSKVTANKEKQGFEKKSPMCGNCLNFTSEIIEEKDCWGCYKKEKNMRCTLGNFKVIKSNWCKCYQKK